MTKYIIELEVKEPIKRFEIFAETWIQATQKGEEMAKQHDMIFKNASKHNPNDKYDTMIHKQTNLGEF